MIYIIDDETGNKVSLSVTKLLWLRFSLVLSLIVYGIFLAMILSSMQYFVGLPASIALAIMFGLYGLEIYLWFANKVSPCKFILAGVLFVGWKSVFEELEHCAVDECSKPDRMSEILDTVDLYNDAERLYRTKGTSCL